MEKPKLNWKTFTQRRRLDVRAWLSNKGIKKYSELKEWCEKHDIISPKLQEISSFFKKESAPKKEKQEPVKQEPVKQEEEKKSSTTATTSRTATNKKTSRKRGRPSKSVDSEE